MDIQAVLSAISTVGFPIAVASFCLYKLDKTIEENTLVITQLAELIKHQMAKEDAE